MQSLRDSVIRVPIQFEGRCQRGFHFHGSGATGVSGIWTENAPAPQVFGAIAGSRP